MNNINLFTHFITYEDIYLKSQKPFDRILDRSIYSYRGNCIRSIQSVIHRIVVYRYRWRDL